MNCDVLNYSKRWVNICFFFFFEKKNRGKPAAQYICTYLCLYKYKIAKTIYIYVPIEVEGIFVNVYLFSSTFYLAVILYLFL